MRAGGADVVWHLFISPWDTLVNDRRPLARSQPVALALYALEWLASRLVTHFFLGTRAHARWFEALMHLPQGRVGAVPLGTDPERFPARPPANGFVLEAVKP